MLDAFERWPVVVRFLTVALLMVLVGLLDYLTGFEISFAFFYVLPVGLAAWSLSMPSALAVAVLSAGIWLMANQLAGDPLSSPWILGWNATTRLGFFVVVTVLMSRLRAALERERTRSRTDFLTGTLNSRAFHEQATIELERIQRYRRPFTVLYLDLDNFKTVNDRYGHSVGDDLLRTVAQVMRAAIRRTDTIARLGGDEFAILLPETNATAARAAVANLRTQVHEAMRARDWPVTLSIGALTCTTAPESGDALIRRVDRLMYEVKHATKDGVTFGLYDAPPGPLAGPGARQPAR